MRSRHPRCTVEFQEVTFNAAITALRDEDVDLLVAEPPVVEPDIIVGPVLFSERRALVVPADHPLAVREAVTLEDLALLPLVMDADVLLRLGRCLLPPSHTTGPPHFARPGRRGMAGGACAGRGG
ncbi:hypothetical protein SALBM311S_01639 [Streptomyces alboniger]